MGTTNSVMAAIQRRLRALQYPNPEEFKLDYEHMRVMTGWLENQKIREYPLEDRELLCSPRSIDSWLPVLLQYMKDLDIAGGLNQEELLQPRSISVVARRLLDRAIGFEYGDDADTFNCAAAVHASDASSADQGDLVEVVQMLATATGVPMSDDADMSTVLSAIKQVVQQRQSLAQTGSKAKKFDQNMYPLGFSTGDVALDRAATLLRLVHINHLRELQSSVNDIIRTMQDFTANPKTDSALGKVGY